MYENEKLMKIDLSRITGLDCHVDFPMNDNINNPAIPVSGESGWMKGSS